MALLELRNLADGIRAQNQKNQAELLRQQNEEKKNRIAEIATQAKSAETMAKVKKLLSEERGTDIDNILKKQDVYDKLRTGVSKHSDDLLKNAKSAGNVYDIMNPAGQKENLRATEKAKAGIAGTRRASEADIKSQLADSVARLSPAPSAVQVPQDNRPLPDVGNMFAPPAPKGGITLPPPPTYDTGPAVKSLKELQSKTSEGIEQREYLRKQQEIAVKGLKESRQNYVMKMQKNMALQRNLAENPPSYRSAVSGVGWFKSIVGLLDASISGHIHENPSKVFDTYVEQELHDQKQAYATKQAFLTGQANMYKQFYDLDKDEFEAESSVRSMLYKGIADDIDSYANMAKTEQEILKLDALKQEALRKSAIENENFKNQAQKQAFDEWVKKMGIALKVEKLRQDKIGGGLTFDNSVVLGRGKFKTRFPIAKSLLAKFNERLTNLKATNKELDKMIELTKQVETKDIILANKAVAVFLSPEQKRRRGRVKEINRIARGLSGKGRIPIVGPGALSNQERKVLEKYFEVQTEGGFLSIVRPLSLKVWEGIKAGDYKHMAEAVKKINISSATADIDTSLQSFRDLTDQQRYDIIKSEFNY